MNKSKKTVTREEFTYPAANGLYTSRQYSVAARGEDIYAASTYYFDKNEGVVVLKSSNRGIHKKILIASKTGYALSPSIAVDNEGEYVYVAWSEYDEGWYIRCIKTDFVDVIDFSPSKSKIYKHEIFPALGMYDSKLVLCYEGLEDNLTSSIYCMHFKDAWSIEEKINTGNDFCKRPKIVCNNYKCFIVWDAYGICGYDIYCTEKRDGKWCDETKISSGNDWDFSPSAAIDSNNDLLISWVNSIDVKRQGVISKANHIMMAKYKDGIVNIIKGNGAYGCIQELYLGLLPGKRYFGYNGLRRNPQTVCFEDGSLGLFWETQRDEEGIFENITNGHFLCLKYINNKWSGPFIIHDGGSCHMVPNNELINDDIRYFCREDRVNGIDIKFYSAKSSDAELFEIKHYMEWEGWKPIELKSGCKSAKIDGNNVFWGDLHCHSIYSPDAEGYPDELIFYARDKAGIDFCGITDNDFYPDNIYKKTYAMYMYTLCKSISGDNSFLAFFGYEWTYHKKDENDKSIMNHRIIIFFDDNIKIANRAQNEGSTEKAFVDTMKNTKTLWFSHHGVWGILDPSHDTNVEITSAWAVNIDQFDTIKKHLDEGNVFGFSAASDNHRFIPGNGGALCGIICDTLTRDKVYDALKDRRVYATTGNRTKLKFEINDSHMGSIVYVKDKEPIKLNISCAANRKIEYVKVMRDYVEVYEYNPDFEEFYIIETFDHDNTDSYYYVKIKLKGEQTEHPHNISDADGCFIWSSPIWIKSLNVSMEKTNAIYTGGI